MKNLMNKLGFYEEEIQFISSLYKSLEKNILEEFNKLKKIYFMTDTTLEQMQCRDFVREELIKLSKTAGCYEYSLNLIFLLYCLDDLKANYETAGYDVSIYYDTISDITCKMRECRALHNIIGIFAFNWFHKQFLMQLFSLGRFQYVKGEFTADTPYCFKNITVNPHDEVYYIHIPSGGSMTEEKRYASYKKAFDFFAKNSGEHIVFVCDSWLLYPQNRFIFPETSNMMGFLNDFDIIKSYENAEPFRDAWRVFNKAFDGDISTLPQETTLQKNYAAYLAAGNKVGHGYGIIIFDGEHIVNKKS